MVQEKEVDDVTGIVSLFLEFRFVDEREHGIHPSAYFGPLFNCPKRLYLVT